MKTTNKILSSITKLILKIGRGNLLNLKVSFFICILLMAFNCSENPANYIEHLNGYWEIEEVTLTDGTTKQYRFSETIDYININDSLHGFRKKLKPGINNVYYTTGNAESFIVKIENDSLNIYYNTAFNKWKETVLEASPKHLKVSNESNVIYLYKRYTPIELDLE
ncbi:lipocalin family protein [Winogradskyella sp.]|jgi:hypothetical protein|uniref:lipocalin family protein n=1 Tax=Winogradskyella sp. TaxID=1883156 RepID=UPI0025DCD9F4|nr:lipocalin family protein [Winogradskyella sp.]MCT4628762.1 hypothetical protein [Winogradskyella sp.]